MAIREVFIRFNALLLQDYRDFLRPIDSPANDYSKAVNRLFDAEGERAGQPAHVMTSVCVCVCVCVCVRARACVRACMCALIGSSVRSHHMSSYSFLP